METQSEEQKEYSDPDLVFPESRTLEIPNIGEVRAFRSGAHRVFHPCYGLDKGPEWKTADAVRYSFTGPSNSGPTFVFVGRNGSPIMEDENTRT